MVAEAHEQKAPLFLTLQRKDDGSKLFTSQQRETGEKENEEVSREKKCSSYMWQ